MGLSTDALEPTARVPAAAAQLPKQDDQAKPGRRTHQPARPLRSPEAEQSISQEGVEPADPPHSLDRLA
jgi:hypothetical protein